MRLLTDIVNLLFPKHCAMCGTPLAEGEKSICSSCLMMLPRTDYHLVDHSNMEKWFWGVFPVERAAAFFHYDSKHVRQLIWQAKYFNRPLVGRDIANLYAQEIVETSDFFSSIDCIIPTPLHWRKQMKRGYNQCHFIAQGISKVTNIPIYKDVVRRVVNNPSQTKTHGNERQYNVADVFRLVKPQKISGKHILVIDDVLTTGSTVKSLAQEIAKAGDVRISVLTLAVASRVPIPAIENYEPDHKVFGNLLVE